MFTGSPGAVNSGTGTSYLGPLRPIRQPGAIPNPAAMQSSGLPGALQRVAGPAGMREASLPGGLQRVQGPQTNEGAPVDFGQYRDPYDLGQPDRFDPFFSPDNYDRYASESMDRYRQLVDPYREQETDRFQQNMFKTGAMVSLTP